LTFSTSFVFPAIFCLSWLVCLFPTPRVCFSALCPFRPLSAYFAPCYTSSVGSHQVSAMLFSCDKLLPDSIRVHPLASTPTPSVCSTPLKVLSTFCLTACSLEVFFHPPHSPSDTSFQSGRFSSPSIDGVSAPSEISPRQPLLSCVCAYPLRQRFRSVRSPFQAFYRNHIPSSPS